MNNENENINEKLDKDLLYKLCYKINAMERINLTSKQKTSTAMIDAIIDCIKEEVDKCYYDK